MPAKNTAKESGGCVSFTEYDRYLFGHGNHYEIYKKLGAHVTVKGGKSGVYFACYAPHAKSVSVIGNFNDWNPDINPMIRSKSRDIFEVFIPDVQSGDYYKFHVQGSDGKYTDKADPYAFFAEIKPGTASRVCDFSKFIWHDRKWLMHRPQKAPYSQPTAIYEVHPGSFMRHPADGAYYSYKELAGRLIPYVKEMGYTHIELMGIAEYPFDGSWGYQVTGYYAPTSRYGSPADFMAFVDACHAEGIGVILDWVPAHFPKDAHGLYMWDGEPLYEYDDPLKREHPDWGTHIFNYGKPEISNFLIANALFWISEYHIDGLRVDAVASMLYLDYGKKDGEWRPNPDGSNTNLEAVEFLKHLNSIIHKKFPGVITIAEESTTFPKITKWPEEGGLGFTFKWNMGWMHDFLEYISCDPLFRKGIHNKMTFGMTYIGSENYILVLSHDEVVHLKKSLIEKCPGDDDRKFETLKAAYAFFMGHPGKKLLFMGQDFGQHREWSEERELDWFLLGNDARHSRLQDFFKGLLYLYNHHPALYLRDCGEGFEWINAGDANNSVFSFVRYSEEDKKNLLFVISFTPIERPSYRIGVPRPGEYRLTFDETRGIYGKGIKKPTHNAVHNEWDGREWSIDCPLPSYGVRIFEF